MSKLFEKFTLKNVSLRNRSVLTAAYGSDKEKLSAFAQNEVGLIITGGTTQKEIFTFESCVDVVHKNHGKIAIQIVTDVAGQFEQGGDAISVSCLSKDNPFFKNPIVKYVPHHAATEEEIEKIIVSYAEAAKSAKAMGVDAIEIHSAHQSLLSQFLSPLTNKRKDDWGGSLENRTRIHKKILENIRKNVGENFPIIIKIGVCDCLPYGLSFEEGKKIAFLLASYGYDALEISQGLQDLEAIFLQGDWNKTPMRSLREKAYFRFWTQEIKKFVKIPVIMQGGLRSYDEIENILHTDEADLIGMCRALISEPNLIKRWKKGKTNDARCIACNQCIINMYMKNHSLECVLENVEK